MPVVFGGMRSLQREYGVPTFGMHSNDSNLSVELHSPRDRLGQRLPMFDTVHCWISTQEVEAVVSPSLLRLA
jgi:hypothetical protein